MGWQFFTVLGSASPFPCHLGCVVRSCGAGAVGIHAPNALRLGFKVKRMTSKPNLLLALRPLSMTRNAMTNSSCTSRVCTAGFHGGVSNSFPPPPTAPLVSRTAACVSLRVCLPCPPFMLGLSHTHGATRPFPEVDSSRMPFPKVLILHHRS